MCAVPDNLLLADLDRLWSDWSLAATYRKVTVSIDPGTGLPVESYEESAIAVVPGRRSTAEEGSPPLAVTRSVFHARLSDLPTGSPVIGDRLVVESREWSIDAWTAGADGHTCRLMVRELE